jgi:hypothetical protein
MALGREAIYSAFFTQLSAALLGTGKPFNYGGRRPVPDSQLAAEQYPAFFMLETGEIYDRSVRFAPAKVSLLCNLSVVSMQGEVPDETAISNLNNLADAVENAIQGACGPTAQNTLSGLVQEAWINHRTLVITGSYPQRQSKMNFGVEIVLPHSR